MPATASSAALPPRRHAAASARNDAELRGGLVELVPLLRIRALRLCGDAATADDVVQDTIERALRFSHQYERGTNLRAWALQVLFSVFVTRWRRRRRERTALTRLAIDPCAWTLPAAFAAPDAGAGALTPSTRRNLEALPAGFRAVIILVDLEQRTYLDAADALGVPVGTVMSRLHRGRRLLAEKMSHQPSLECPATAMPALVAAHGAHGRRPFRSVLAPALASPARAAIQSAVDPARAVAEPLSTAFA